MVTRSLLLLLTILPALCFAQYKGGQQDGNAQLTVTNKNQLPGFYGGGKDDGYTAKTFLLQNSSPNIYLGGADGGTAMATSTGLNITPNIYKGGVSDGVASLTTVLQNVANNIYRGGNDDGVGSVLKKTQNSMPAIYLGGDSDGVDNITVLNNNALPDIYKGGIDDGYGALLKKLSQNPLPLKAADTSLRFTGAWSGTDALLTWTVTEEPDLDHFELERSDNGGKTFAKIATVPAGNTLAAKHGITLNFSFPDPTAYNLPAELFLYRLKSVYKAGNTAYAAIVRLAKDKTAPVLVVYPNPSSGHFILSLSNVTESYRGYEYLLTAADGRMIQQGAIKDARTFFNLGAKAAGTYLLTVLKERKIIQNLTIVIAH